jgi:hypothetical protein
MTILTLKLNKFLKKKASTVGQWSRLNKDSIIIFENRIRDQMMAILLPIHELPNSQNLNKLIQSYNLTPHDKKVKRQELLKAMIGEINSAAPNEQLTHWVEEEKGLKDHMDYYQVNEKIKPVINLYYKDALSKINDVSETDEKPFKP